MIQHITGWISDKTSEICKDSDSGDVDGFVDDLYGWFITAMNINVKCLD
jgi:hypothetical protein